MTPNDPHLLGVNLAAIALAFSAAPLLVTVPLSGAERAWIALRSGPTIIIRISQHFQSK